MSSDCIKIKVRRLPRSNRWRCWTYYPKSYPWAGWHSTDGDSPEFAIQARMNVTKANLIRIAKKRKPYALPKPD